jgi:cytochrome P450
MSVAKVTFDHADQRISGELLAWGRRLQKESPISYSEAHGGFWIASRYQDIVSILRDTQSFTCAQRVTLPPQKSPVPVVPLEADEPDHSFYRAVLAPFLTVKAVREHEPRIRAIVTESLTPIAERGAGDMMSQFAALIPTRAMAMVFGFSDQDAYRFDHGFSALVDAAGSGDTDRQMEAVNGFRAFLVEKLAEGRSSGRDSGLVAAILKHRVDGRACTDDEALGLMWSAAGGATDTTKLAIGHAVRELGVDRVTRQKLIDDPTLIPAAVEDSLRLNAPAFMDARYVSKPATLAGAEMKPGDRILLVYGWANRDESAFPVPGALKLDRGPARHLTFGHGIHLCVGMHLAKLELKVVLEEILARMPNYELVDPDVKPVLHGGMMWGYDSLPIRIPS